MKERYFWIGLFIVICSMFGNYLYSQSKQLAEPIFLQHYFETQVFEDNTQLQFFYLSNKAEPVEVSYVTVDDVIMYPLEDSGFSMWIDETYRPNVVREFTHHNLQSVKLELLTSSIPVKLGTDDVWSFNEVQVTFTNGQTIEANIGEVRVYGKLPNHEALKHTYASSSNQNFSQWFAAATESLTIEGISVPFTDEIGKDLFIKIFLGPNITTEADIDAYSVVPHWYNEDFLFQMHLKDLEGVSLNDNLFPNHLNESDFIKLYMYFNPESKYPFDFYITIYGSTDNGEHFEYAVPINSDISLHLTQEDVNKIIQEQTGGLSE